MGSLGPFEILAILLVILLLFGAKRIPEIARGLGKGIREFKDATNDIKQELTVSDHPARPQIQQPRQSYAAPPQQQAQPSQPATMETVEPPAPVSPPPAEGQAPETQG